MEVTTSHRVRVAEVTLPLLPSQNQDKDLKNFCLFIASCWKRGVQMVIGCNVLLVFVG